MPNGAREMSEGNSDAETLSGEDPVELNPELESKATE